ncbi:caspase family protein [Thiothrix litoralis]|uniref:Caspase family protein n=1 Tax=Thiothrix litoralis TaxID=2891210 RepID=A0ABX7WWK1_9GAMM|nr:caspase family protein [Thiothrix litoralis]QTR45315.1 caspase family protein [Thiothrix litoralis]
MDLLTNNLDISYFYASQKGRPTLDKDESGGNPFASALVELLGYEILSFKDFKHQLVELTKVKSHGFQIPVVPVEDDIDNWQILPVPDNEKRVALVMIFSSYHDEVRPLLGASYDMQRISQSLMKSGFDTIMSIDPQCMEIEVILDGFHALSKNADVSLIYLTGHGFQTSDGVYVFPVDYPFRGQSKIFYERLLKFDSLKRYFGSSRINAMFYAGCRTVYYSLDDIGTASEVLVSNDEWL